MKVAVILPAAGLGTRMGKGSAEKTGTSRKQFMLLEGSPILMHTVRKFAALRPRRRDRGGGARRGSGMGRRTCWRANFPARRVRVVEGGNSRQQSVENALAALGPDTDLVAVHDAVRPFIDLETIHQSVRRSGRDRRRHRGRAAVDTVKQVSRGTGNVRIRATLPREKLVLAQTPQVFRYDLLGAPSNRRAQDGFTGTDESSLVERLDVEVSVVLGSDRNIKITKPGDMDLARLFSAGGASPRKP